LIVYRLAITRDFIAQHYLIGGDWGAENALHSHHYRCEIGIEGEELDRHGYLVDIVELSRAVDIVISQVSERTLNELPEFAGLNPSLEHFCRIFWEMLVSNVPLTGKMLCVKLWENDRDWAAYTAPPR
jgi:6-pyruvoyltetrahydropterin/6-carboxytetrahydropterin synthase